MLITYWIDQLIIYNSYIQLLTHKPTNLNISVVSLTKINENYFLYTFSFSTMYYFVLLLIYNIYYSLDKIHIYISTRTYIDINKKVKIYLGVYVPIFYPLF